MTVFKGYWKAICRNKWLIFLYMAIFLACTVAFQASARRSEGEYRMQALDVAWIDEDGGVFADALKNYLGQVHRIEDMEDDKSALQEKMFYGDVNYVVRIPADFYEVCVKNGEKLKVTKVPGSYAGIYADQMVNSFLNNARTLAAAGFSEAETAETLTEVPSARVELVKSGTGEAAKGYNYFFRYMPYMFLAVFGFSLGSVLAETFRRKECRRRMDASPVSPRRQSLEGLLCMGIFSAGLWGVTVLLGLAFYGKKLTGSELLPYYLLNSAVLVLVSLALAYLVGALALGKEALTGIVNVLSLGMCFLGGAFVPLEVMSGQVKAVSQFLPVYWYEVANDILGEFSALTEEARTHVLEAIGIQAVFALAFVCLTLVIVRYRRTEV